MADSPTPASDQSTPRKPARPMSGPSLIIVALVLYVATVTCLLIAAGIQVNAENPQALFPLIAVLFGVGGSLGFFSTAVLIIGAVRWALYGSSTPPVLDNVIGQQQLLRAVQLAGDRLLISDSAKRIAYREQDRNALREAIRDDIRKGDFDAALALAKEMGETYGYREESEQFRDIILAARDADTQRKVTEAIAGLDRMIAEHQWHKALQEASKIQRLYPDAPRVQGLEAYVRQAFEQYKRDLEREFLEAAQRDDIDRAMALLKELDKYLTEAAAAPLRETARGVIGKKRDNLGVQFKIAVQDHEWSTALRVGEQIIREFPNTKMAAEVRSKLDDLRELAAREQAAARI